MQSVKPLERASEDLAAIFELIIAKKPLHISLVQKMLLCYRSWDDYAIHGEGVKIEIRFPYSSFVLHLTLEI